jgi:sucrose-6-phosphate hydrolase SacC (GH32 family)
LKANETLPLEPAAELFHIRAEVRIPAEAKLTFNIRGVPVTLTAKTIESGAGPASAQHEIRTVEILVDRASIEAFVNQGEISSTRFMLPTENGLSLRAEGGAVTIQSLTIFLLNSAWENGVGD